LLMAKIIRFRSLESSGPIIANNGTLTASAPVLDLAQTWNAIGTTFTGLNFTITDTQSANGSRAFDIKSGTTSIFSLRKVGGAPLTEVVAINGSGRGLIIGSGTLAPSDAFFSLRWQVNIAGLARDAIFAWGTDVYNLVYDLAIQRDAADTLAQRRAANPQTFRLYTTWANNGVDFERLFIKGQTNSAFQIGTEKGGTGGARDLAFLHDGTTRLTINDKIRTGSTSLVLGSASRVEWGAGTIYLEASTAASPAYFKIVTASTDRLNFDASGIIGFGGLTNLFPALKRSSTALQVRLADDTAFAPLEASNITATGDVIANRIQATVKNFYIKHPTKPDKHLVYSSLETPYNGVQLTGEAELVHGQCIVQLPDYLHGLIHANNVHIQLTNRKHSKVLYVDSIDIRHNRFTVKCNSWASKFKTLKFFWLLNGVRKDIEELQTEV
jgi:hypothetical protein